MNHYMPYARSDITISQVDETVDWTGVSRLLNELRNLPPKQEFTILLSFLVEYAGGLEQAKCRMEETLVEQAAIGYKGWSLAVKMIESRLEELYNAALAEAGLKGESHA